MIYLAIDPSIRETGYAFIGADDGKILASGVIKPDKNDSMPARLVQLLEQVQEIVGWRFDEYGFAVAVIVEIPPPKTYIERSKRGHTKPDINAAAIHKNNQACGAILAGAKVLCDNVYEVEAPVWKGKLNKKDAQRITGKSNHNEADAIMLGQWFRNIGAKWYGLVK